MRPARIAWCAFLLPAVVLATVACGADPAIPHCTADETAACACSDGRAGTQRCESDRTFGPCACDGTACEVGLSLACACADGREGLQACRSDGRFETCDCGPVRAPCEPGTSMGCSCDAGTEGTRVCRGDRTFGVCDCGTGDAGAEADAGSDANVRDAGVDARPSAPACAAEVIPPTDPTLPSSASALVAMGMGSPVEVFVSEHGIVLVESGGTHLFSREGVELATWTTPREIISASFDGTYLVIADRAAITWVEVHAGALVPGPTTFTAEECLHGSLVSCQRYVCSPMRHVFYTYDRAGYEITRTASEASFGPIVAPVSGREGLIAVGRSSGFGYYRVNPDGTPVIAGWASSSFSFGNNSIYALVGRPATHLATQTGYLLRLDACPESVPADFPGECLSYDGGLGTVPSGDRLLAMEGAADGQIHAILDTEGVFCPSGSGVCRLLQQIDVAGGRVVRQRQITVREDRVWLRYDAWADHVILAWRSGCSSFPRVCTGWTLRSEAYE